MTEPALIALASVVSSVLTLAGKMGVDKVRRNGHSNGNGDGHGVERAIAKRAEIEFQIKMTAFADRITEAIEKGHERNLESQDAMTRGMHDAAGAIRQVHVEIVQHREGTEAAAKEALRLLTDMHRQAPWGKSK